MDRKRLAEEKFRPLKKRMQATVKRLKEAAQDGILPKRADVSALLEQVEVMVSYPGFGDAAYPELVAASAALDKSCGVHDFDGFTHALAELLSLRTKCHANRHTPHLSSTHAHD